MDRFYVLIVTLENGVEDHYYEPDIEGVEKRKSVLKKKGVVPIGDVWLRERYGSDRSSSFHGYCIAEDW